jgi:ABC-type hemin transport system substrate-binding protein
MTLVLRIDDDLGRTHGFARPPRRIVSLVPSDTYSVIALGAGDRLVGRTTYCEHGAGVPTVGGTKNVDVEAVVALAPDLVIANQEENSRGPLEALAAARVPVFVSFRQCHFPASFTSMTALEPGSSSPLSFPPSSTM